MSHFRYTPQHNFTEIVDHMVENHLHEPDWGKFFSELKKVIKGISSFFHTISSEKQFILESRKSGSGIYTISSREICIAEYVASPEWQNLIA